MKFNYQARTQNGELQTGVLEAATLDIAVSSLQRRGLIVVSLKPEDERSFAEFRLFGRVKQKDIVILSRQLSTLFEAKVPVVESLRVIISEMENPLLKREITTLLDDIQGGAAMSQACRAIQKFFRRFMLTWCVREKSPESSTKHLPILPTIWSGRMNLLQRPATRLFIPRLYFLPLLW